MARISSGLQSQMHLLDSLQRTNASETELLQLMSLSLANEPQACLQGHQVYLDRLEKSRNKMSSQMKLAFGHLWMVSLYFLSVRTLSADSSNILTEDAFELLASLKPLFEPSLKS